MRIKIILLAAFFLTCCPSIFGAVNLDDYKKAVDYLNCKAVKLSLQANNSDDYEKFQNGHPCENEFSLITATNLLRSLGDYQKTIDLANEIDSLKVEFKQNWEPDSVITFLSKDIFSQKKNLIQFKKNKDTAVFESFQADLTERFAKIFSPPRTENEISGNALAANSIKDKSNSTPGTASSFQGENEPGVPMFLLVIILALITVALLIVIVLVGWYLNKKIEDLKNFRKLGASQKQDPRPQPGVSPIYASKDFVHKELKDLEEILQRKIDGLRIIVRKLEDSPPKKDDDSHTMFGSRSDVQTVSEMPREIFYLSYPNDDGNFSKVGVHPIYKEGTTMYRFTKKSPESAEFQIDERESSINLALQYPEKSIEPACEAENAFDRNLRRIVTIRPGKASLINDQWVVTDKAKIRYEQ